MKPMLASSVPLDDAGALIVDDDWVAQQKLDGDRVMVRVTGGNVLVLNRDGVLRTNPFPRPIVDVFARLQGEWCFDGELLDELWLFDLPSAAGKVLPSHPYRFRLAVLEEFFRRWEPASVVRLLPTAHTMGGKSRLVDRVVAQNGEGLIFKRLDAPYVSKRSRQMVKLKFTHTADCVVTDVRRDGLNNCVVALFGDDRVVEVGSLAMLGKPAVSVGDVVEVKYLYASGERKLVQPAFLRHRFDKAARECTFDQLVYSSREVIVPAGCYRPYVRQARCARATGTRVTILDAFHPDSDYDGPDRWVAICEHDTVMRYSTLKAAHRAASHPQGWCLRCRTALSKET